MHTRFHLFKTLISRHTILPPETLKPTSKHFTTTSTPFDTPSPEVAPISNPIIDPPMSKEVALVHTILNLHLNNPSTSLEKDLDHQCKTIPLTDDYALQVLKRHRSDYKSVYRFFHWTCKNYTPGTCVYNEVLDVLGKMRRMEELHQVFDIMSLRKDLVNERTFEILLNRYAAAHKVEEAIGVFYLRKEYGFAVDLPAFQTLLLALCRYKHVEDAERLFLEKRNEYPLEIKTLNILLNGWCVRDNLREMKRFWRDIVGLRCKFDRFTYGIFINALSKSGNLGTAVKLFRSMWKMGEDYKPDVVICNSIIDALCFKKRIPEAIEIFKEMKERGPELNTATYNTFIKYFCKIGRMYEVYELLDEMERKKGSCAPSTITFHLLLRYAKKPEVAKGLLERMKLDGCLITCSTYNMILKLYLEWNDIEGVQSVWDEMENTGMGLDWRSYTIMIHGLHKKGRVEEALKLYDEMMLKGMTPEPRTNILVTEIKEWGKETDNGKGVQEMSKSGSLRGLFGRQKSKQL